MADTAISEKLNGVINNSLDYINHMARTSPQELVSEAENRFREITAKTAQYIFDNGKSVLMLAGPSSAGKTTTARLIGENIEKLGARALTVSLDDFYKGVHLAPVSSDGKADLETVHALDIPLLENTLCSLMEKREGELPIFDFTTGERSKETRKVKLSEHDIVIVEGLHALNPLITDVLPQKELMKVYISVSSRIYNSDSEVILSKRNIRFIRRLVRDYRFRSSSVFRTYEFWPSVTSGEDKYLFPFEERSDIKINSIHIYEPCIMASLATELLSEVPEGSPYYENAKMLIEKLAEFERLPADTVPQNSLLREFIGF